MRVGYLIASVNSIIHIFRPSDAVGDIFKWSVLSERWEIRKSESMIDIEILIYSSLIKIFMAT